MTDKPLKGRTAVVTGGGRPGGLGAGIAARLAQDGAHVVISDVAIARDTGMSGDESSMAEVAEAVRQATGSTGGASHHPCDVTNWDEVRALAAFARDRTGSLDIWINNAGIGYLMKPLAEVTPEDWRRVIDVNLTGAFFGISAAAAIMVEQGRGGRIINIASQAAKSGFPHAQAYCASKHGLVGLARSAAIDLGPARITVNNVCPNHVTTGLGAWQNAYFAERAGQSIDEYLTAMAARIPLGRPGLASDTANAVAFLCSDLANYITAESLNVSGGEEPH